MRRVVLGIAGFLLLYALLAFLLPRIPVNTEHRQPEDGIPIFLSSNGVHCDFVFPVRTDVVDWNEPLPPERFAAVDRSFRFVSIGWGDKGFYLETPTWADLRFGVAFRAVFFLGSAAMHVTYGRHEPKLGEQCRRLVLTEQQYRDLTRYVLDSFERDESGKPRLIDQPGYTPQDRFFDARGTYSFVQTCNEWTGAGLRSIGVRTGLWTPFPQDVLRHVGE